LRCQYSVDSCHLRTELCWQVGKRTDRVEARHKNLWDASDKERRATQIFAVAQARAFLTQHKDLKHPGTANTFKNINHTR
jgi:hypothetical protein